MGTPLGIPFWAAKIAKKHWLSRSNALLNMLKKNRFLVQQKEKLGQRPGGKTGYRGPRQKTLSLVKELRRRGVDPSTPNMMITQSGYKFGTGAIPIKRKLRLADFKFGANLKPRYSETSIYNNYPGWKFKNIQIKPKFNIPVPKQKGSRKGVGRTSPDKPGWAGDDLYTTWSKKGYIK